MTTETANAYLRTKVFTASPAELRLMLIEGAIKFARQGRDGLAEGDHEKTYQGLSRSKSIILELMNSLRPEIDHDLCENLTALYTYMYKRLIEANLEKDPAIVDEVISLLEYDRETWVMLMDKLAKEGGEAPTSPAMSGEDTDPSEQRSTISLEG